MMLAVVVHYSWGKVREGYSFTMLCKQGMTVIEVIYRWDLCGNKPRLYSI
jgi:hypothetical protein